MSALKKVPESEDEMLSQAALDSDLRSFQEKLESKYLHQFGERRYIVSEPHGPYGRLARKVAMVVENISGGLPKHRIFK